MGGRLSQPKSADGLAESSRPLRQNWRINSRTIVAPVAAFTMAGILFFYSRTSIQAARLNAQKHRQADGGQINWRKESLRRHGQLEQVGGGNKELIMEALRGERAVGAQQAANSPESARGQSHGDSEQTRALEKFKKHQKTGSSSSE